MSARTTVIRTGGGVKLGNNYASQITPRLYMLTPKAVFAAIAVSPPMNGGVQVEDGDTPDKYILREWGLLYRQGIVPQPPPKLGGQQ